jgi:phosphohistidine phosphatase
MKLGGTLIPLKNLHCFSGRRFQGSWVESDQATRPIGVFHLREKRPRSRLASDMKLCILRHGIAAELGEDGSKVDRDRKLTRESREKLERVSRVLCEMEIRFDLILSSPFARTRQTAEIVAANLNCKKRLKFLRHLEPDATIGPLIEEINRLTKPKDSVLLVGHEPFLSGFISRLITGNDQACITLKKGGLCFLDIGKLRDGRCASLECLMAPRHMRRR